MEKFEVVMIGNTSVGKMHPRIYLIHESGYHIYHNIIVILRRYFYRQSDGSPRCAA